MSSEWSRKPYPSAVSEEEWACAAPSLALVREDASQRGRICARFITGLRSIVKCGCPWRYLPTHFPPWWVVYPQAQRWIRAGVFESMAHDLRVRLRLAAKRTQAEPTAAIVDSRGAARYGQKAKESASWLGRS